MTQRVIVLLLLLASLGGLLFAAVAGILPYLDSSWQVVGGSLTTAMSPAEVSCGSLLILLPMAVLPALGGLAIWHFGVRRQSVRRRDWIGAERRRESVLEQWLDRLAAETLAAGAPTAGAAAAPLSARRVVPPEIAALDDRRRARLLRFLCETGLGGEAAGS